MWRVDKEMIDMIVKKRKEWNRDPNTWDGKFYIPCKIDKKKIEEILTS